MERGKRKPILTSSHSRRVLALIERLNTRDPSLYATKQPPNRIRADHRSVIAREPGSECILADVRDGHGVDDCAGGYNGDGYTRILLVHGQRQQT